MRMEQKNSNISWHAQKVSRGDREQLLQQKGCVVWCTGLSGSGKSTIANELAYQLHMQGRLCYVLDGDNIRHGLTKDLGFSESDRDENIRRVSEVCALFVDAGVIVITAFISPFRAQRNFCRSLVGENRFVEVYVKAGLQVCEQRDPKGLYKKARQGVISDFTGVDAVYEEPLDADVVVDTQNHCVSECVIQLISALKRKGFV
jgi:adenylylsulfate kinase